MSFADGLLLEREREDEKTRRKVLKLIERLRVVHFTKTGWAGDKFHGVLVEDKEEAIKYLKRYAEGNRLL